MMNRELRNRALMALPLLRAPHRDVIERVAHMHRNTRVDAHVRRQALLTHGAMIYQYEVAADAAVTRAELDNAGDAEGEQVLAAARKEQAAARKYCEQQRRQLHEQFLVAEQG